MATSWEEIWNGSISTTYLTDGNWTANMPTAGENALVPAATNAIAGADQSAIDLGSFWVDRTFTKTIGDSGSPLIQAANLCVLQGTGDRFIKAGGAGIDYVVVDMNDPSQRVVLHPNTTALMDNVTGIQGNITIAGEAGLIGRVDMMGGNAQLDVSSGAGGITTLVNGGSEIVSRELITSLYNRRGIVTQVLGAGDTITNAYLAGGSTLNFDHAGTITLVIAEAGAILDLNRTRHNKTITTLIAHPDAIIRKGTHVTITNDLYGVG